MRKHIVILEEEIFFVTSSHQLFILEFLSRPKWTSSSFVSFEGLVMAMAYRLPRVDSPDPLANSLLQSQFPGTIVLELDWLPLRSNKNDPLVLCIAGSDNSFRLVKVNIWKLLLSIWFLEKNMSMLTLA